MDVKVIEQPRCRDCKEAVDNGTPDYVYCCHLNSVVWGASIQCEHGKLLNEVF